MNELALFAGSGGCILGSYLLGWETICAVEIEKYPRRVLLQRQRDGIIPRFPIWDDIRTFDGTIWSGRCDIITGGFPCQDISAAGKGSGIDGERSGLWKEMSRVVREVRPKFVFVENSPRLTSRGLHRVLGDLAKMGYNARWCVLGADDIGAPHKRKRIWILAYTNGKHFKKQWKPERFKKKYSEPWGISKIIWWDKDPADISYTDKQHDDVCGYGASEIFRKRSEETDIPRSEEKIPDTSSHGLQDRSKKEIEPTAEEFERPSRRLVEPRLGRVAYGVACRVDRLKSIGNGQIPAVAAIAFIILSDGLI